MQNCIRFLVYIEIWICFLEYAFTANVYGHESTVDGGHFCCCSRLAGNLGVIKGNPIM